MSPLESDNLQGNCNISSQEKDTEKDDAVSQPQDVKDDEVKETSSYCIEFEVNPFPNIAPKQGDLDNTHYSSGQYLDDIEKGDVDDQSLHSRASLSSFFSNRRESIRKFFKGNASRPLNKRSRQEHIFAICAGICLSFNSGFINGCCLSGLLTESGSTMQSVSGFTGAYTKAGLGLAEGDTSFFGFEMSMILSFIGGSCISALINPTPVPHQVGPTYGPTFLVGSVFLVIASILSSTHPEQKNLFYFAAAANGLQNGMTSMYSANLIRTTHLTGTSTDIGLFLGQALRGNFTNLWKLGVLTSLAISFWFGSFVSFFAATTFRGFALIFNACLFFIIGIWSIIFVKVVQNVSFWQAMTGTWHWQKALDALNVSGQQEIDETREDFCEVFNKMDVHNDGALGADELYTALKASGMQVTKKGAQALVDAGDFDGDGKISQHDWVQVVRRSSMDSNQA